MSRTQDGRLTEQGNRMKLIPDIDFKLDGLVRKLGELGGQIQVLVNSGGSETSKITKQTNTFLMLLTTRVFVLLSEN